MEAFSQIGLFIAIYAAVWMVIFYSQKVKSK